jgi:hypothetical protein
MKPSVLKRRSHKAIARSAIVKKTHQKRVFKTKTFSRWAKGLLTDVQLCKAANEIAQGLYEAELGAGLCKKRIAIFGQGKRGATRTLVAKESAHGIFFLVGRQKSDPGSDFSDAQVDAARIIGAVLQKSSAEKIDDLVADGVLKEICHDEC